MFRCDEQRIKKGKQHQHHQNGRGNITHNFDVLCNMHSFILSSSSFYQWPTVCYQQTVIQHIVTTIQKRLMTSTPMVYQNYIKLRNLLLAVVFYLMFYSEVWLNFIQNLRFDAWTKNWMPKQLRIGIDSYRIFECIKTFENRCIIKLTNKIVCINH